MTELITLSDAGTLTGAEYLPLAQGGAAYRLAMSRVLYKNAGGLFVVGASGLISGANTQELVFSAGTAFNTGGASIGLRGISGGYNNGGMEFYTGAGATGVEVARIDSSGRLGLGITAPDYRLDVAGPGRFVSPNSGTTGAVILRDAAGNPGGITIQFVNNAATVEYAYIKANVGSLLASVHFMPDIDNTAQLGISTNRWSEVFCVNAVINTSDAREKEWVGTPDVAAQKAALRIIEELGFYQWLEAIDTKGKNNARWHFGAMAQNVATILIQEGVEASQPLNFNPDEYIEEALRPNFKHSFLCFDTWDSVWIDEMETVLRDKEVEVPGFHEFIVNSDGFPAPIVKKATVSVEEQVPTGKKLLKSGPGNRFGIRYEQLSLFLLSALGARSREQEARIQSLESRLDALEMQTP